MHALSVEIRRKLCRYCSLKNNILFKIFSAFWTVHFMLTLDFLYPKLCFAVWAFYIAVGFAVFTHFS